MSRRQAQDFADDSSPSNRSLRGMARRMAIRLTRTVMWQLTGYRNIDTGGETVDAEPFTGIGFYARPSASDKAEAVLVQVGDARHVVIVSCRNEDARRAVVDALNGGNGLAENEAVMYSRAALVHIKSDGTVEARTPGGTAVALCTLADAQAIRNALNGHSHTYIPGTASPALTTLNPSVPAPTGTTKFKAE